MDSSVPDKNSSPPTEALFFYADSLLVHIVLDDIASHIHEIFNTRLSET